MEAPIIIVLSTSKNAAAVVSGATTSAASTSATAAAAAPATAALSVAVCLSSPVRRERIIGGQPNRTEREEPPARAEGSSSCDLCSVVVADEPAADEVRTGEEYQRGTRG